jgi:hypothetical protein
VWGSEFPTKGAKLQGDSADFAASAFYDFLQMYVHHVQMFCSHQTMVSIEHDHDELQHVEGDASFKVIHSLRPAAIKCANHLLTPNNVLHCALGMQRWTGAS